MVILESCASFSSRPFLKNESQNIIQRKSCNYDDSPLHLSLHYN